MRRPRLCCRPKCWRKCRYPQIGKSHFLVVYSSLRCSRRLMLRVRSCCHWFSLSLSSFCYSRPYAQWSACTYRGQSRRFSSSLRYSEQSSAWVRPFLTLPASGQPSFQRAFLGFKNGLVSCESLSIHCRGSWSRWRILGERDHQQMSPPRRKARLFCRSYSQALETLPTASSRRCCFFFFLLVSGDIFLHRLVEILPRFRSKRQVVDIAQQIESDISAYLVTITIMNAAVGVTTGLAMWLTGVGDPILWGTATFLLNYVPIVGPALGVLIFLLAGQLTHDTLWQALLPAGLYLGFHLIEGESVTPMLLARRFTLDPVLVIISLVFWFWMWGVPGAILAVPMLAITKIICDRIHSLVAFGHFLEG